jgi:TatA/E family protein of Tat protein translocase
MGLENPIHLLVLAVIILLVFGSSQLPKIARSAGKHAREAKDGITSFKEEFDVGLGENNPLHEVTDTLRSANPKTIRPPRSRLRLRGLTASRAATRAACTRR